MNVIHRRCLNTTRAPNQSAAAAAVQEEPPSPDSPARPPPRPFQSWKTESTSTLTAAELREKEARRQQRLDLEATAENERIAALQRRQAVEQERQAKARALEVEAEKKRIAGMEALGMERRRVELEARAQRTQRETAAREQDRARKEQERKRYIEEARKKKEQETSKGLFSAPAAAEKLKEKPKEKPKSVAMPAFGAAPTAAGIGRLTGGWGGGADDVKPVQYAEPSAEPTPPPSQVKQQRSSRDEFTMDAGRQRNDPNQFQRRKPGEYNGSWNSRNQDSFWSSQQSDSKAHRHQEALEPAKGSSAHDTSPFNMPNGVGDVHAGRGLGTEYRATPYKPSDPPPPPSAPEFDDKQASWQHLQRRRTASDPPPPPPQQAQSGGWQKTIRSRGHSDPFSDPDEIERSFQTHQQQRRTPRHNSQPYTPRGNERAFGNPDTIDNPNIANVAPRKCARCLEPGHTARECTGPTRANCHICGVLGHMANECPSRRRGVGRRQGSDDSEGVFRGVRAVGSTAPDHEMPSWNMGGDAKSDARYAYDRQSPTEPPRQQPPAVRAEYEEPAPSERASRPRFEEPTEDEGEVARRAKRSARGFEDAIAESAEPDYRKDRRTGRRNFDRQDEEADDMAAAEREERRAQKAARKAARQAAQAELSAQVNLPEFISVQNLAQTLGIRYESFVARLERLGYDDLFPGKVLNAEMSGMVAMEYNFEPIFESATDKEDVERDLHPQPIPEIGSEAREAWQTRPPVVTIMGHVDHGKTTILDYLRKSSVAAGEAGGITQHIGAFSVPMTMSDTATDQAKTITFLDTPGHAAFLSMRQRGANVTDIVILVVAADDSVKPQTLESLRCATQAGVPILVAINKVDKEGADTQRVKQDLARNGVEIEDFGGEVQVVEVSGKTGQGMEGLEEAIVTLSEILDHRADVDNGVEGWVLEATTKAHGRVATVLVKRGTLRPGAVLVAGKTWARVKTLRNERGEVVDSVGPGLPVEVDGWREQAAAGDQVLQAHTEQRAGSVVDYRLEVAERERMEVDMEAINATRLASQAKRAAASAASAKNSRFAAYADVVEGVPETEPEVEKKMEEREQQGQIVVPFLIKADVSGSAEAVAAYIPSITSPLITTQILASTVGPVHESDVDLAAAAGGHIIAFNLPPNEGMKGAAEARGVRVLENNIIYRVLDDVKEVLEEKLPHIVTQRVLGEAEVGAAFDISLGGRKTLKIAGCKVRNGVVGMRVKARVLRGGERVYDGMFQYFIRRRYRTLC